MFNRVSEWLDVVLETDIPNEVVAFDFSLYEDSHYNWSMELIGASEFNIDNEDWLCSEVTDFNTRDNPLRWHKEAGWEEILNEIVCALKEYLENGKYADVLKTKSGVGVGFVDGSIEILYAKIKEKIWRLIEQKISEWQEDDIYAISLYVFDEEDDSRRPVAVLGYNTERQVQRSITEASDEQEARWNYAFWLQNEEMCLGRDDTAEDIREWFTEQDLWKSEDAINSKFVALLIAVVQDIHESGLLKNKFGREIPILIHELEYYKKIAQQNIEANGEMLDRDFVSFCMPYLPMMQNEMQASQNEMLKAEKAYHNPQSRSFVIGKRTTDMRKVAAFITAIILVMSLFWVLGLIINSRNKTNSEDTPQQAEHFDELTTEFMAGNEEYESLVSSYEGEKMEWFDCESFADIPQNQEISKTEIVEKNAKNTGELRISSSITKLWLNEDEAGAAEINAALREIYEVAEAEMEVYNQEILDEYLFEDGVLQEDLDEWLLYPLEEWLAISTVNYVASIGYVDENYLCLSMNGDNYVAGGAHGYYWSDYWVFDRHIGQRLFLEDFVDNNPEDIKEIVKNHIMAAMPYSKGEQSENALEQNRFFLAAEGLGIHYDIYEIGDYASGSFDLVIPFELFDMKEDMCPLRTTK